MILLTDGTLTFIWTNVDLLWNRPLWIICIDFIFQDATILNKSAFEYAGGSFVKALICEFYDTLTYKSQGIGTGSMLQLIAGDGVGEIDT